MKKTEPTRQFNVATLTFQNTADKPVKSQFSMPRGEWIFRVDTAGTLNGEWCNEHQYVHPSIMATEAEFGPGLKIVATPITRKNPKP